MRARGKHAQDIFFKSRNVKKYFNVMIDEQNFYDQPVKSNLRTGANIRKVVY